MWDDAGDLHANTSESAENCVSLEISRLDTMKRILIYLARTFQYYTDMAVQASALGPNASACCGSPLQNTGIPPY